MAFGDGFATQEKYIKAGFDRIMDGTSIQVDVKYKLYGQYKSAHVAGSPRQEQQAFNECITENFDWPWFEKHRAQFKKHGLSPYLWWWPPEPYEEPSTAKELLYELTVKELRKVVKELCPGHRVPRTRGEIVKVLSGLSFEQLRAARVVVEKISANVKKDADYCADSRRELKFKLELLRHSVTKAVYAAACSARHADLDEVYMKDQCEVIIAVQGCPVEEQVARQFNLGVLNGLPPFFPGDRSMVTLKSRSKMKERGFTADTYKRKPLD